MDSIAELRQGLGDDIDIGIDFHAKTSPSVASILVKEFTRLEKLRESMLLKPRVSEESAKKPTPKKPGSASKRKPRVRDENGKIVNTSTRSLTAREARQKSKRKG